MVPVRRHARDWYAYLAIGGLVLIIAADAPPVIPLDPVAPGSTKVVDPPPPQQSPREKADPSKPDQRGSEDSPFLVKVISNPPSAEEATQREAEKDEKRTADLRLLWLTAGLLVVGAVQAFVFWIQADRLKQTIAKMGEVAKGQSEDMKASTEAAKASTDAALAALPRGSVFCQMGKTNLRAWISEPAKVLNMFICIKNFGSAPAIIDLIISKLVICADFPDWQGTKIHEFLTDNVIAPSEAMHHPIGYTVLINGQQNLAVNANTKEELVRGRARLYIMVRVIYRDIYRRMFETSYCVSYDPGAGRLIPEGGEEYNYQT